jgi:hypothetical protein
MSLPKFATDVSINKGPVEDHTKLLKLGAFDDTNQLKTCECTKEHEIVGTYLIIHNDKMNEMF